MGPKFSNLVLNKDPGWFWSSFWFEYPVLKEQQGSENILKDGVPNNYPNLIGIQYQTLDWNPTLTNAKVFLALY